MAFQTLDQRDKPFTPRMKLKNKTEWNMCGTLELEEAVKMQVEHFEVHPEGT